MKRQNILLPFIIVNLLNLPLGAWETDNFTTRPEVLNASSTEIRNNLNSLNDMVNKNLESVIDDYNSIYNCKDDLADLKNNEVPKLISWIEDKLGGTRGEVEEYAEEGGAKMYHENGVDPGKFSVLNANLYNKRYGLQGSLNLEGHVIGPDKLGHFFDQGYDLMEVFIEEGQDKKAFQSAMYESNRLEEGFYGLKASDVKSYGDMGANFSGLTFFYNLLSGKNPQVTCNESTGKYKLNYHFDFGQYVNDSWDEGINCSFFESVVNPFQEPGEKILTVSDCGQGNSGCKRRNMRERLKEAARRRRDVLKGAIYPAATDDEKIFFEKLLSYKPPRICPVNTDKCKEITQLNCSNYFVSPRCIAGVFANPSCNIDNFDEVFAVKPSTSGYNYNRPTTKPNGESNETTPSPDISK